MPHQIVLPFEDASGWGAPFPSGKPPITASTNQVHSGQSSEASTYQFATPTNDYVAFERSTPTPIPANTTKLGLWIYGDGSGHILQLQLTDAENETLQYRLRARASANTLIKAAWKSTILRPAKAATGCWSWK